MKLKMKTIVTLLIAIFMISTFAVAMPVMALDAYSLFQGGDAVIGLSTDFGRDSSYSIKQIVYSPSVAADEARILFNYYGKLDSIIDLSFYAYLQESSGSLDSYTGPYVTMEIDRDGDGSADAWLLQTSVSYTEGLTKWTHMQFTDETAVRVAADYLGDNWIKSTAQTFGSLKEETAEINDGKLWGDCKVLKVKVGIGTWTNLAATVVAFVDDVTINDATYDFEPKSEGPVSLKAHVAERIEIISISVTPTDIDFGTIVQGESSTRTVTVTSTSSVNVDVLASIDPGFYYNHMIVGGVYYGDVIVELAPDGEASVDLVLTVPTDAPTGLQEDILVFEAVETL